MGFLPSNSISVFPSARRMNKQVSARLISEASLANIVNKLIETDGFVITPEPEDSETGFIAQDPFEFNIHGYYFRADHANDITALADTGSTKIYANIFLDTTTDINYTELKAADSSINELDESSYFKGVEFSNDDPLPTADYSLLLFSKEQLSGGNSGWIVPIESRLKFVYTFALGVDGGEIT